MDTIFILFFKILLILELIYEKRKIIRIYIITIYTGIKLIMQYKDVIYNMKKYN